ncbi:hypothetical protein MCEMSHM24_01741 [Comamonadaceae bacterium]
MRWITALSLQQWADTLGARNVFPGMVADLIRASAGDISNIRFPNGDKGQVRGFDGVLEAAGVPPYVPDGLSIWEFGVNAGAAAKAESDFEKRTKEVDKAKRMEMSFVFVSPRTWDNPKNKLADWVDDKKKLCEWKDVLYIDGSMVEDWLRSAPAVSARYAKYELNCFPATGVRSTDEFWDEYSTRFGPQLVEAVLLAGRAQQAEDLVRKLSEGVSKLPYAADSPDEVVAFAIAAIRSAPTDVRFFLESRTLVVDTEDAARQVAVSSGLSFLPRSQAHQLAGLLAQKGPTVVSAGADDKKHGHEVLRRPSSTELGMALEGMGFNRKDAYAVARSCGRSLAVLARRIPSGTAPKPEWIEKGAMLLPALLAGAWHVRSESDQKVIRLLASEKEYAACEAPLRQLAKLQDPPIDYITDVWALRASVDAFVNLGHLIGVEHLERFSKAAKAVFGKAIEPPKADEVYRPAEQRGADTHSRWLRDGMMNTLLHMAVLHEQAEFVVPGTTPQDYVNGIVRDLPGLSRDHRLLVSLQDQMALLAEAAPVPFLEALERLLEGDAMAIRPIFEEHKGLIGSQAYYYGVLWGLEVVAWDPQLLLRASVCLAKLAKIDPGGAVSNRPINSLRAIFLPWAPNTGANAAQRKGVLAYVLNAVPEVAWDLLAKLLPRPHDHSSATQAPVFREFDKTEVLTYALVWDAQNFVVEQAIARAGTEPSRWITLIHAMSKFPKGGFERMVAGLDLVLDSSAGEARFTVWEALRKEVNRHRTYAGTDWAVPEEALACIDPILARFAPQSAVEKSVWLFDDWMPDVPGKVDAEDPTEAIDAARQEAVTVVMRESGTQGLIELAQRSKLPEYVAEAAKSLEFRLDELGQFFLQILRASPNIDVVAGSVMAEGYSRFLGLWTRFARETFFHERVAPERVARILTALGDSIQTWNYVKEYGPEVNDAYWRLKHSYFGRLETDELLYGIRRYLENGRPLAALNAATRRLGELPTTLLVQLLDGSVPELNASASGGGNLSIYNIEHAFDELRTRGDIAPDDIAALEFRYLPVFHMRRQPLVLHTLLVQRPRMFMDAICAVFKPTKREPEPMSEGAEKLAVAAYELLTSLQVLPGQAGAEVDYALLWAWCQEVRVIAVEVDRIEITDQRIGALLAHAPSSQVDGAWPHEAVRAVIEQLVSEEVERGLAIERFNMRGVYSKAIGEGGQQERVLAEKCQDWATAMPGSPRTSAMLMKMAESWRREAELADQSAAKEALRR